MKTSLGVLNGTMIERVRSGQLAQVAQELLDSAHKAQHKEATQEPGQVLAHVLGELQALHEQLVANDKALGAAQKTGVDQGGAGQVRPNLGQRDVRRSALYAARLAPVEHKGPALPTADVAALQLRVIYARFPSLTVDLEPSRLAVAAEKLFGDPSVARGLVELLAQDKPGFLAARTIALTQPMPTQAPPRRAVVSGLSNGGMIAVALLAKSGYQVDAFEQRGTYSRNIQYGGRQALIDQLASIDPKLAEAFLDRVARHVEKGSVHTLNAARRVHTMPAPGSGDATAVPESGEAMLAQSSTVLMECKVFETLMHAYILTLPNVTLHDGANVHLDGPDAKNNFSATHAGTGESLGTPDLVVVSEGANSSTFRALGVKSGATSPQERYIAGYVPVDAGGVMAKHFRDVEGEHGPERLLIASMANAGAGKTWICAGVAAGVTFHVDGVDPRSPEYQQKQRALIEEEFRHSAALVMETPVEALAGVPVHGPIGDQGAPTLFTLQQRISDKAAVGNNVVGFGDVVGNSHFSVGGGMQIAAISHGQRLKRLLFDVEVGVDKHDAMARYDEGALQDSMAWGKRGVADFYPYTSWQDASKAYVLAIEQWRQGKVKEPLEALEKIIARMPQMPPVGMAVKRTVA